MIREEEHETHGEDVLWRGRGRADDGDGFGKHALIRRMGVELRTGTYVRFIERLDKEIVEHTSSEDMKQLWVGWVWICSARFSPQIYGS